MIIALSSVFEQTVMASQDMNRFLREALTFPAPIVCQEQVAN